MMINTIKSLFILAFLDSAAKILLDFANNQNSDCIGQDRVAKQSADQAARA